MLSIRLVKVLLYTLLLVLVFDLQILAERNQIHDINIVILIYSVFISYRFRYIKWHKYIITYCVFVIMSCITSVIINHQPLLEVLRATYPYVGVLSFYLCAKENLSSNETLILLKVISYIFCICYFFQWLIYPEILFIGVDEFAGNQYRARMAGSLCCFILIFYGVNRYIINKKMKELIISLIGLFPAIMMGFRSVLASTVLFLIIMVLNMTKNMKRSYLSMVGLLIFAYFVYQTPIVQEKLNDMSERNETDNFQNEDYVRYASFFYYEIDFQQNIIERIFGGGIPLVDREAGPLTPGNKYQNLVSNAYDLGLYWNDLGIIGLSNMIGIPAIITLIILIALSFKECSDEQLMFIRYMLVAILLASIMTSQEIYRHGNFVIMGLLFYYIYIYKQEKA